jgi:hypothetical protein
LEALYSDSNKRMRAVLELLATTTKKSLTTTDFAEAIGKEGPRATWSVAGVLGAFGKRVNAKHGGRQWPFDVETDDDSGEIHYSMPAANAKVIAGLAAV